MAKTSKVVRDEQRKALYLKQKEKRDALRKTSLDMSITLDERMQARLDMQKLSPNGSPVRLKNRCAITGRPRGYNRRIGISRVLLRELAHQGVLPGLKKASW